MVANDNHSKAYGLLLKDARKDKKISQSVLAQQISSLGFSVTNGQISNIERGYYDKRPEEEFVRCAAQVLDMNINEALLSAGYAPVNVDEFIDLEGVGFLAFQKGVSAESIEVYKVAFKAAVETAKALNKTTER